MTTIFFISLTGVAGILIIRGLEIRQGRDFMPRFQRSAEKTGSRFMMLIIKAALGAVRTLPITARFVWKIFRLICSSALGILVKLVARSKPRRAYDRTARSSSSYLKQVASYRRGAKQGITPPHP
jgi:hypothetical protein